MLSGFMMGLLDHEQVQGHHTRADHNIAPLFSRIQVLLEPTSVLDRLQGDAVVHGIDLTSLLDHPVYRVERQDGPQLYDASSGEAFEITEDVARKVAEADFSGNGRIVQISAVSAPSMEIRKHRGDAWRVDFDDAEATSLYVSRADGAILERRNDTWRLFDIFWMLHIMDYQGRENFNNVLLIFASLIAAWFSITGIILFFDSFRKSDFLGVFPDRWWRKRALIAVCAPHGEIVTRVASFSGRTLYDALARADIMLPSNCGGGGTCGLCVVALDPAWPESAADLRLIPAHQRREGIRLSCQAEVSKDLSVTISNEVLSAETATAEVVDSQLVTPFIREITLRIDKPDFNYHAGSYVHVVIPPHEMDGARIETSEAIRAECPNFGQALKHVVKSELRRAYSLAAAPSDHRGMIVLNVRFMLPPAGALGVPSGFGSSFMWSLRKGDCLNIVGPLGDFRAQETNRDMVVIGGGAGMAPLRSIIRDELLYKKSDRRIHFWYGARSKADLFYATEFDDLQTRFSNFCWQPVLSEPLPDDGWTGQIGFVHAAVDQGVLKQMEKPGACEFYICGPPPMLAATRQLLARLHVPESQVFFDDFGI
ncbi:MAG TPA: NADH:ubiquinone reductase (Na(+)-transporting) subunit F [Woeseiaceae bacterium]|nr:NADH:ubiquinone reductase (Na(+)-transporting) subunit F [Woeseiaceae bacterium]